MKSGTAIILIIFGFQLTSIRAQDTEIYLFSFRTSTRYTIAQKFRDFETKDHFLGKFESDSFFEKLDQLCTKDKIVPDSIFDRDDDAFVNRIGLIIKKGRKRFVVYQNDYIWYKGNYFQMTCDVFNLYIPYIPDDKKKDAIAPAALAAKCPLAYAISGYKLYISD